MSIYAISCTYLCQKNAFDRSCTHRNSFFSFFLVSSVTLLARIYIHIATNHSMYHIVIIFIVAWVATVADTRGQSFIKGERREKRERKMPSKFQQQSCAISFIIITQCVCWCYHHVSHLFVVLYIYVLLHTHWKNGD